MHFLLFATTKEWFLAHNCNIIFRYTLTYFLTYAYWSLQVVKPVNLEAMSKWVGSIPDDVVEDMANIAPMLAKMGYDPNGNPPKYGDPDPEVLRNTNDVKEHNDVWEAKGEMVKSLSKKNEGKWMREKCFRRTEDLIQIFSETKKKVTVIVL